MLRIPVIALCCLVFWGVAGQRQAAANELNKGYSALEKGDYKTALKYLSLFAAAYDDPRAQYNLGIMYNRGLGVEQDHAEAAKWFSAAAEQGNQLAQYALGHAYSKGQGVLQDQRRAFAWFRAAANQGHPSSQTNVGNMYYNGQGVQKDIVRAHMWWNMASQLGLVGAKKNLSMVEAEMSDAQLKEAQVLFKKCMQTTNPNC